MVVCRGLRSVKRRVRYGKLVGFVVVVSDSGSYTSRFMFFWLGVQCMQPINRHERCVLWVYVGTSYTGNSPAYGAESTSCPGDYRKSICAKLSWSGINPGFQYLVCNGTAYLKMKYFVYDCSRMCV